MEQAAPHIGYRYFSRDGERSLSRRNVDAAVALGRERLRPRLSEMDYLIFEHRRRLIGPWCEAVQGSELVVLDIGGRIQPYRALFEGRLKRYVAVDLLLEGVVDVIGNCEELPFRTESFDVVLSTDTLQYVRDPTSAVHEMHRVLKPGGALILSTREHYPEHHDEYWRFLPAALSLLASEFATSRVAAEGNSGAGVFTALNVLLHRDIRSYKAMKVAERTSIPLLNLLGLAASHLMPKHQRFACGCSLLATK
jgi:SAM-dependent methyltransferase